MISLLRWVAALPLAVLAAFAAHLLLIFSFSRAHGFEAVDVFWESLDMAGMPISGTYMMFITRVFSAFTFVYVGAWVVPQFKKQVGFSLAIIVSIFSLVGLIYLAFQSVRFEFSWGFGMWYRHILETVSIIFGCVVGFGVVVGAGLSSNMESRNGHA